MVMTVNGLCNCQNIYLFDVLNYHATIWLLCSELYPLLNHPSNKAASNSLNQAILLNGFQKAVNVDEKSSQVNSSLLSAVFISPNSSVPVVGQQPVSVNEGSWRMNSISYNAAASSLDQPVLLDGLQSTAVSEFVSKKSNLLSVTVKAEPEQPNGKVLQSRYV